ncbi:DUF6443 domain-containing protein [Chryseobacterium sp. Mn2064]|uniref:DUF6443 domain-containing protein n=1 Tax=Chryseobacterium sp. Mn2064 TaxID=3395263 RepID=UPI003BD07A33
MKKIIVLTVLFATGMIHAQTSTENYIKTKTYLDYNGNQPSKSTETVQYLDGLGRPKQIVDVAVTPLGRDVVTHIEYDQFGRQTRDYLPVPQLSSSGGSYYSGPLGVYPTTYGDEKIYTEKVVENSPLNRVIQQTSVGKAWSTHPVQFEYDTNKVNEVYQYLISTSWENGVTKSILSLPLTETYIPNQLYKSTIKDEDGIETVEFKNKKGQTVLTRRIMSSTVHVDTYYVYNEYGQLVFILPPEAIHKTITDELLNTLCYQYRYDTWGRQVEKKIPGKGWEYTVYDKQDRVVATQDANLKEKGQWMYSTYDQFGRVAFTGLASGGDRTTEQGLADGVSSNNNVKRTSSVIFNSQGMDVFYDSNGAYPNAAKWVKLLSINYYDSYPGYAFNPSFPQTIQGAVVLKETLVEGKSTKGLPVMAFVKNIEDDNWTKSYIYYDTKGRAVGSYSINHLGGYTKTESALDFAGVTKQTKVYHKRLAADAEKVITQTFTYDNQNRLLVHKHQIDSNPEEILVQNEYNELSQIKNKKLGGTNIAQPLQNIDYTYNIKGWLTKINDPANLNGKLFGYEMKYANPINTNISSGKFNGSITEVDWNNASENVLKRYNYTYDALSRLKDAVYSEPNASVPFNNNYNEYLTYDLNGNIKTLKRNAFPVTGTTATQVDDLVYEYTGNRLTKVIENALNDTGYEGGNNTISYDLNGNMKNMLDKGIQSIAYNDLNLSNNMTIQQNSFGQLLYGSVGYLYSAGGTKLRKTYSTNPPRGSTSTQMTDYLDGFQYSYLDRGGICLTCRTENAYEVQAYKNIFDPNLSNTPEWKLDFVATAEGFYSFTENRYIYQYRDHLGNSRVTFGKNSAGAPEITDTNNYYPFGLSHTGGNGLNSSNFGSLYSYKYNGKELQETGMFDYGWRQYLPDLGRWNGVDQLAENYISTSPYAYVANNPVSQYDVDGRWFNQDGTIDTSGRTPGFTTGRQYYNSFLGIDPNYSSGGGGATGNTEYQGSGEGGNSSGSGKGFDGETINIPEVVLSGKSSLMFGLTLRNWVNAYMEAWNAKNGSTSFYAKTLSNSYFNGFVGGVQSSWNYIKGQFFGESYWNGLANTFTLGAYGSVKTVNSLIDVSRNISNYTANDYSYGAGYLTEKAAEAIILKEASQINPFGLRGGYGVFGKNGLKIGGYKVEALYQDRSGGGTIFSMKSNVQGGNLLRWDYGFPHDKVSTQMGIHSHFRFIVGGSKYGSSTQYPWHAPFNYWNYKK